MCEKALWELIFPNMLGLHVTCAFPQETGRDGYHWKMASETWPTSADHSSVAMMTQREGAEGEEPRSSSSAHKQEALNLLCFQGAACPRGPPASSACRPS